MTTQDLERDTIKTLQDSLSNQLALMTADYMHINEAASILGDRSKLAYLAWLLHNGSMDARVNAAALVEKLAAIDRAATMKWAMATSTSNGVVSGLFKLLREGGEIPHAEKASLSALAGLYYGATEEAEIKLLIAEKNGGVSTLIEQLAGARRARAERVLTVVKAVSMDAEGQAALKQHALTIPALVRSLLVISELANELAISVLSALTRAASWLTGSHDASLLEEAAQLGLAQKLLVVAQMYTNSQTKLHIRHLLKAMSASKCLTSLYASQILQM